ncbi:helix-turn-helix domain-containing protein [Chitinophaga sp. XS-30]|uniref:helix-turn-helix domain-containing protein n=1 Tax=Chitinophaga sp. XS-30 TaxID=2604421 RepID=UPI00352A64C0
MVWFRSFHKQEARLRLKHADLDILEISHLPGFRSLTHFSGFFKKCEGISPSMYRKV